MAVGRQGKVKLTSRWSCRPRCFRRTPVNVSSGAQDITKSVSQIPSRDQKPEGLLTAATPRCREVERWKSVVGTRKTTGSESWRGRNGNRWQGRGGLEDFSVGRKRQLGFTPLTPRLVLNRWDREKGSWPWCWRRDCNRGGSGTPDSEQTSERASPVLPSNVPACSFWDFLDHTSLSRSDDRTPLLVQSSYHERTSDSDT
jgi:hypothetical protein